jgi:hypothetical protein
MIMTEKKTNDDGSPSVEVQAVIRKKILFSTRPTPLKTSPFAQVATPSDAQKRRVLDGC